MSIWEAIILGLVQGLTEFLPISSTAHIIIASHLLGIHFPGLVLEIFLHIASALAVIIYFRADLWRIVFGSIYYLRYRSPHYRSHFYMSLYLGAATAVTGVLGLTVSKTAGEWIRSPNLMGVGLLLTAIVLIALERFHRYGNREESSITWLDSILVGIGQAIAVLPGISRSGSTLVTALFLGLERETAVRFSFLLAIPVILGSSVLSIRHFFDGGFADFGILPMMVSFIVSFAASLIGITWLIAFLRTSRLIYFAVYCILLGIFCLTMLSPADVPALD
ncbi:MAG: hypothetical protein JJU20_06835 [Opitutales bacterium]|nr:hypothetical protein [Opitutales bacterium]